MTPVTVIGLGNMGAALAAALVRAGHPTTVWNRSDRPVPDGAHRAATVTEAVTASPLVLICVSVYANVDDVLDAAGDALAARTVVNLTNGTPRQARAMADAVRARGAAYLDGGIMAVPPMIGTEGSLVLYSGAREAFDGHAGTLGVLGAARYLGTDPGRASLYDVALLSAMYGMFGGVFQAFALLRTEGVPAAESAPLVRDWLAAMLASVDQDAAALDRDEHATDVSTLATNLAALPNLLGTARDAGVSTALLDPHAELLRRAVKAGHGGDGLSRLVDFL
ncbi:NAD(P)-dependent oxidoreductase [Actinomadura flavalba]|uniref:NAD(P)-dependent oxidoreductase n=1 Tax=Actinomadura flavalba TaxID=1120938 RepID=UPI0003604D99|nr:NAD(P)-binding domain-containing protein [Actinomadura flavalba]